jgi:hypothetical protein
MFYVFRPRAFAELNIPLVRPSNREWVIDQHNQVLIEVSPINGFVPSANGSAPSTAGREPVTVAL